MLDITKLIPFKDKHSVSEAIFILFLTNPIVNSRNFDRLLWKDAPLHEKFQKFSLQMGVNLAFPPSEQLPSGGALPNLLPKISGVEQNGFIMQAFLDGKPSWVIRYQPSALPGTYHMLTFHSLVYEDWDLFYEEVFNYIKIINEFEPGIFVSGYALNYVDQFNWHGEELPVSEIFNHTSRYLPNLLFDSKGIFNSSGTFSHKIDNALIAEGYMVGANQIQLNEYNIFITHQSSRSFDAPQKLSDICASNEQLRGLAAKMHQLNKDFLLQTLVKEICERVGLK